MLSVLGDEINFWLASTSLTLCNTNFIYLQNENEIEAMNSKAAYVHVFELYELPI